MARARRPKQSSARFPKPPSDSMPDSPRVYLETREAEGWQLRTSDLPALARTLGEELLVSFCRAFVWADRITSLLAFFHLSLKEFPKGSPGERRNFLTYYPLLASSLKELSLALGSLKIQQRRADIWDEQAWSALAEIQRFGEDGFNSRVRNAMGFHLDAELMADGLMENASADEAQVVFEGEEDGKQQRAWFPLGHLALLAGLKVDEKRLSAAFDAAFRLMVVDKPLEDEFLRVLEVQKLRPFLVRVRGGR